MYVCGMSSSNPQVVISLSLSWSLKLMRKLRNMPGYDPTLGIDHPFPSHGHSCVNSEQSPQDKWKVYCNPYKILFMLLLFLSFFLSFSSFIRSCSPRGHVKWLTAGPTARCKPQRDEAKCGERGTTSSTCVCEGEINPLLQSPLKIWRTPITPALPVSLSL